MILLPHFPILWVLCGKGFLASCWGTRAGMVSFWLRGLLVCAWAVTALLFPASLDHERRKAHSQILFLWTASTAFDLLVLSF